MKKNLYIRSGPYQVNLKGYNLQEIGLCKAFTDLGYDCTVLYYSKKDEDIEYQYNGKNIHIMLRHGIRILRSGIYPCVLHKKYLKQFDNIIISEYSQIMAVLLCKLSNNVYIYNGPYYNLFKIPPVERVYDFLYAKYLNKCSKKIFTKTIQSQKYLYQKGISNTCVVGVGLDTDNYNNPDVTIKENARMLIEKMVGHINLIYVGSFIDRKNVRLIIQTFNKLINEMELTNLQLIMIGKGKKEYVDKTEDLLSAKAKKSYIHVDYLENAQLQYVYSNSQFLIMPSKQEIWGMSIMEAMYFGVIPVSSYSAGGMTMINNGENGVLVKTFNPDDWSTALLNLLKKKDNEIELMKNNAHETITSNFTWKQIALKMLKYMK